MFAHFFLRLVVALFRVVPYPVLYHISDLLAFLLQKIVGYRKAVIHDNLLRAFPEKSAAERQQIADKTYRNLTDVTLETLKSYTTPLPLLHQRCRVKNPDLIKSYLDKGHSVILAGSHNGNWEYGGLTMPQGLGNRLYGVYKPLTNRVVSNYMNVGRARGGIVTVAMDDVVGVMRKQKNSAPWAYMLIADQSPSSRKRAHWVSFFGHETASLPGVDVLSRTFGFPVFRYTIQRVRRGFYEIEYQPLWLDPATASEGDITRAYTVELEREIRDCPENWLWSHKRWKMQRETV
jgi:KDO2-lipid IV(A) lauroyltransferase